MAIVEQSQHLSQLVAEGEALTREAIEAFGALSVGQLNWKSGPDRWSVGQCFDHLIITNGPYISLIESIKQGDRKSSVLEALPVLPSVWGKLLKGFVDPTNTSKLKAPPAFQTDGSTVDPNIIQLFGDQQSVLLPLMKETKGTDLDRIVTSPAAAFVTYSLMDAYTVVITHERRHFNQAKRVTEMVMFPKG